MTQRLERQIWDIERIAGTRDAQIDLRRRLRSARLQVAITGAGMSRASGLPLLSETVAGVPLREFFRQSILRERPRRYYDLYRAILSRWGTVRPNAGHVALAQAGVWVITQNVDGLHRLAGSRRLIELHGNFRELRCESCGAIFPSEQVWREAVPRCATCTAVLKPGIVLEGEQVRHAALAADWVGQADVLWVIGTKLEMRPVAQLPSAVRTGTMVVRVNQSCERWLPYLLGRWDVGE
ncbi:MAG: iron dicitrate transport regulator FecR [Alicyclobacillus sp.]|nr:iron dicitrate transport regulator FecR [Alicyclobacillus sp.]